MHPFVGIMAGLLVNPIWITTYLSDYGGENGTTENVNSALVGESDS